MTGLVPDDNEIRNQYGDYFDKAFLKSFALALLFFAVVGRMVVGVRQRLERRKNIIDVDP